MRAIRLLGSIAIGLAVGCPLASAQAQSSALPAAGPPALLDVPYLPQSTLLCGGAAVAMVERWWGRRGVYPEDFASLVVPALGGIRTTDLDSAVRARGWQTRAFRGTPESVRAEVEGGAPVIALIEVGRRRYHYVVVLGWSQGRVTYHDPAGAPFTTVEQSRFVARWDGADRWALSIRPALPSAPPITVAESISEAPMPCSPWLDRAVDAAAAGALDSAARILEEAGRTCPQEPLVLRELAAVRFKQGDHPAAIRLAEAYLEQAADDRLGWQLLATSRYLNDERGAALNAWNRIDRPVIDLLRIDGIRQVRFTKAAAAIRLPSGSVLTRRRLAMARRRLAEMPALRSAAVDYQPLASGTTEIRAAVVERPALGRLWRIGVVGAIRAASQNQVELRLASPTGAGELWGVVWRWNEVRPRTSLRVDVPAVIGLPGVLSIEGTREQFELVADPTASGVGEERRRASSVGFGAWVAPNLRPSVGLRLERWLDDHSYLALSTGAEFRGAADRLAIAAAGEYAAPLSNQAGYVRLTARASWASSVGLARPAWSARFGADWADARTPRGIWTVVGGNFPGAIPLRAHPLTLAGLRSGEVTGRVVVNGGVAADHPLRHFGPFLLAAGVFVDGASGLAGGYRTAPKWFHLDAGAGLRIGVADGQLGVLRIDLARNLAGPGGFAFEVGVHQTWPPFQASAR